MSLLGKIKKLRKLKFAPTLNPYELTRRLIPMIGAEGVRRQMYQGIDKDARKAQKKGQLGKFNADLHASDSFKALISDVGMTMEEVDGIIKNATKEG